MINFSTNENQKKVLSIDDALFFEKQLRENPLEGWETKAATELLKETWAEYLASFADWKSFISLTFRVEKFPDVARSLFYWWVKVNNSHVFGKRYQRAVGHSYFSYVYGIELQKREVIHFHVLVDKPINYSVTHDAWGDRCGFAWIDGDLRDKGRVINYVCKYVAKGGEVDIYKAKGNYSPKVKPKWWREGESGLSRVALNSFIQGNLRSP